MDFCIAYCDAMPGNAMQMSYIIWSLLSFFVVVFTAIQVCKLSTKEGPVTLTATSTSYDTGLLQQHGVKMSSKVEMLSTSVDLMLVSEARIEPTKLSIFNHPSNKV